MRLQHVLSTRLVDRNPVTTAVSAPYRCSIAAEIAPFCYGVYVIVITSVVAFHWISIASVSATNRRGRSVLPLLMMGTTLALLSMVTDVPFSFAVFLPIHSSSVLLFRMMVAFCADASQVIVPPAASTTARIGRKVRALRMIGAASREEDFLSTSIVLLPILNLMMLFEEEAASYRKMPLLVPAYRILGVRG